MEQLKRAMSELKKAARQGKGANVRVVGRRNIKVVRNVGGAGSTGRPAATQHAPIDQEG
jgi:hypothetical protein